MERIRDIFWKVPGVSLFLAVAAGIAAGFVFRLGEETCAGGSGICGLAGLGAIPGETIFGDQAKAADDAVK